MKAKLEYVFMIVFSVVMAMSVVLQVGYDFGESSFWFQFRVPKPIEAAPGCYFINEPIAAVVMVMMIASVILIRKTYKPMVGAGIALALLELIKTIEIIALWFSGQTTSALFEAAWMFLSVAALLITTALTIKRGREMTAVYIVAIIGAVGFAQLYLHARTGIVLSQLVYYALLFAMFVMFNSYYRKNRELTEAAKQ
ncbi:MAG: hypothetical protein NC110_08035 [Ruminococcus sp.]|nr:hypothetical protein [Ruminococcus sp.]